MGNGTGDFYNPTIAIAARGVAIEPKRDGERMVDQLMLAKDDANKADVMRHLGDFSCREELERYVEHQ